MNVVIVLLTANINKTGQMTPGGVMVCDYVMDWYYVVGRVCSLFCATHYHVECFWRILDCWFRNRSF